MDPVHILLDPVHGPGPRGVHGPGVHVLYFPRSCIRGSQRDGDTAQVSGICLLLATAKLQKLTQLDLENEGKH